MAKENLQKIASQVRRDIIRMVTAAKSGHPGGSMSSADILTALYFQVMDHNPATWTRDGKGQDMFILSAGHLAPVYYSVLARAGYFPVSELGTLRKMGSRLQGHPSVRRSLPGVTQASGSLGQGVSVAAGLGSGQENGRRTSTGLCPVRRRRVRGRPDLGSGPVRRAPQPWQPHRHDRLERPAD